MLDIGFMGFLIEQRGEIFEQTLEHLWLTLIALFFAIVISVPLGILMTRKPRMARPILTIANVVQTIPSLALLGFMIPLLGIGVLPAIVALFLYAILPILRNTYTGISEVDPSIKEAAIGMGMTDLQSLTKVELPIALPTLFAGIKTATVINIGVATLAALIGAGGLGVFIFRGIALNNTNMILAGAIPAAVLALLFNAGLGLIQKRLQTGKRHLVLPALTILIIFTGVFAYEVLSKSGSRFKAGFPSEFIHREDGYNGLASLYDLKMDVIEMDIGLMYDAINNKKVDLVSGFSTDGRIEAFDLVALDDDKSYFPPYHAAPLIRNQVMREHPEIANALSRLSGRISDKQMASMNYLVDEGKKNTKEVAESFLDSIEFNTGRYSSGDGDIIIGSKNFTESFILAEVFKIIIENYTVFDVELKLGFGGTKLVFDALVNEEIDLYPEYTGTGLLVLLPGDNSLKKIIYDRDIVYDYVNDQFKEHYDLTWLSPLGFNNTHAMVMRKAHAKELNIKSISDLSDYLKSK